MRVASTMPANDASKAVCGASECSLENGEYNVRKETQKREERRQSRRAFKNMKIVVKVNDKLNANVTESKRILESFSANKFEATREQERDRKIFIDTSH